MSLDKNLRWTLLYHSHMRMRHSKKGNEKTTSCRVKHATFNLHFKGLHTNLKALCIVFLGQCSQFTLCGDGGGVGGVGGVDRLTSNGLHSTKAPTLRTARGVSSEKLPNQ